MAKKKVGGGNDKSKDMASEKYNSGNRKKGKISETDKDTIKSGGSEKVLRSRTTTKGGAKADEKAKGKKPMVEVNLTIKDEGTQKGGGNGKGKRVSGDRDWILKPHNPREGNRKISEKGKRKLVVEKQNGENPIVPAKRRRSNKEIAVPNTSYAERVSYNLRERKAVHSFQKLGLSESGFVFSETRVERVKVYKSGSRERVTGKINSYNDKKKLHKILYVDGKSEELDLKSQRFEVEVMPGEASTLCTKRKPNDNLKSQKTKKTYSDGRSDDRTVERKTSDTKLGTDGDHVLSEFAKVSQKKTVAKPRQKMTINAGNKKAGNGAAAAKSKPLQKPKKDEGHVNVEKRKNPSRK